MSPFPAVQVAQALAVSQDVELGDSPVADRDTEHRQDPPIRRGHHPGLPLTIAGRRTAPDGANCIACSATAGAPRIKRDGPSGPSPASARSTTSGSSTARRRRSRRPGQLPGTRSTIRRCRTGSLSDAGACPQPASRPAGQLLGRRRGPADDLSDLARTARRTGRATQRRAARRVSACPARQGAPSPRSRRARRPVRDRRVAYTPGREHGRRAAPRAGRRASGACPGRSAPRPWSASHARFSHLVVGSRASRSHASCTASSASASEPSIR